MGNIYIALYKRRTPFFRHPLIVNFYVCPSHARAHTHTPRRAAGRRRRRTHVGAHAQAHAHHTHTQAHTEQGTHHHTPPHTTTTHVHTHTYTQANTHAYITTNLVHRILCEIFLSLFRMVRSLLYRFNMIRAWSCMVSVIRKQKTAKQADQRTEEQNS